jgi:hypothetical protein
MEQRVVEFIKALRNAGVRISVAESIDAMRAIDAAGVGEKDWFRTALRATLVKESNDIPTFDELFPQYFSGGAPPPMQAPGGGMSQEDRERLADMLEEMLANMTPEQLRALFESMMKGQGMSREQIRQMLDESTSVNSMPANAPGAWAARRALRELEFDRLEQLLQELLEKLRQEGVSEAELQQLAEEARENRDALGQQIAQEAAAGAQRRSLEEEERRRPSFDDMLDQPIENLQYTEQDDLRRIVARLASQLRSRAALRQRRASKGTLDAKRTIRANLRYGAVPLEILHRQRHLKPRLTIICDVSGSMRPVASFMLLLVYALQDQISRTRPFVYYRTIADVTSDFNELRPEDAVRVVPERVRGGPYQTSLGSCLDTFTRDHLDAIDRRTTVIFLGDGDDHMGPPNARAFEEIKRRAYKVLWFNPEHPYRWGREDNHMHIYGPLCDAVHHVGNLRQLAAAVDTLFS